MAVVGIRELSRDTSRVIRELERTGEPVIVTREGRPVGALVSVDQRQLENVVLATAPDLVQSRREAEEAVSRGEGRSMEDAARARGIAPTPVGAQVVGDRVRLVSAGGLDWLSTVLSERVGEQVVNEAEDRLGLLANRVMESVEHGAEGAGQADEVGRIVDLNARVFAILFKQYFATALASESDPEAAAGDAARTAADQVDALNDTIVSRSGSVTAYETALEGICTVQAPVAAARLRKA